MQYQRPPRGRALGYVGCGPREDTSFEARIEALESGCAAVGLTLVAVLTAADAAPPELDTDTVAELLERLDVEYVAVDQATADLVLDSILAAMSPRRVSLVLLGADPSEAGDG